MSVLVSGSIAHDYIMDYHGVFSDHLLPEHLHSLSVCFTVGELKKNYGGTGLNIAYALGQLGADHRLLASCGSDFDLPYKDIINYQNIGQHDDVLTASAHILTDKNNNQITAFFPGAMARASELSVVENMTYALISPNDKEAMMKHAREAEKAGMNVFFHPGQQINMFDGDEIAYLLAVSDYLYVNEYELSLIYDKTGLDEDGLFEKIHGMIVTYGSEGSSAIIDGERIDVPAVLTENVIDPTGAGDAYIGGLVAGLVFYEDWKKAMQMGTVCAHYCIQKYGTQTYSLTKDMVEKKMMETYI